MSDEELIDELVSDDENVSDDPTSSDDDPTPSPTPGAYCTSSDVNSLFGDISDDVTDELFVTAINNGTAWINSNLTRRYVPIPNVEQETIISGDVSISTGTNVSVETGSGLNINKASDITVLRTAAIYYSASDILLSLYHGDELPVQYDVWFQKAQTFLEAYIDAYLNSEADEQDLLAHQVVGHSKSRTYQQKRMDKRRYW